MGAVVAFFLFNYLLMRLLLTKKLGSLLSISSPYLGAVLLAVGWIYHPAPAHTQRSLQLR